jgi:threonine aldolase
MRQAGVLAAAGIIALDEMVDRLAEDHQRAAKLAAGLAGIPGLALDPGTPYTNMIFMSLSEEHTNLLAGDVAGALREMKILVSVVGERSFRLVTHYWIDDQAVDMTLAAFRKVL